MSIDLKMTNDQQFIIVPRSISHTKDADRGRAREQFAPARLALAERAWAQAIVWRVPFLRLDRSRQK